MANGRGYTPGVPSNGSSSAARFRVGPAYAGYRLDQFLQRMIPKLSRSRIQKAIDERVRLSWPAPVKASTPVRENGEVFVDDPEVNEEAIEFDPAILYDDGDLLAIDKPPGLVVHPTHSHLRNTVITLLRRQMNAPDLTLAHRLDAETSGVLLLGRHTWAARKAQSAFQRGKVEKSYLAIVFGCPEQDRIEIDAPLGYQTKDDFVFRQLPGGKDARASQTEIEVLERLPGAALVRASPRTGRRHQIRAHLATVGHPIVGDKLYVLDDRAYRRYLRLGALDDELRARLGADRLMLHSHTLSLPDPRRPGERITIVAPLPADMAGWLDAQRRSRPGSPR